MKIPHIPTGHYNGRSHAERNPAGKGSEPRPGLNTDTFRDNYDAAFGERKKSPGFTRVIYKSDGTRVEIRREG